MDIFTFVIVAIVVLILISILAQVFGVGTLLGNMSPTQRMLFALLGLVLILVVIYWFITRYVAL